MQCITLCLILFWIDLFGIFNKIAIVQSNFDLIYNAIASYHDHFEHLHLNQLTAAIKWLEMFCSSICNANVVMISNEFLSIII